MKTYYVAAIPGTEIVEDEMHGGVVVAYKDEATACEDIERDELDVLAVKIVPEREYNALIEAVRLAFENNYYHTTTDNLTKVLMAFHPEIAGRAKIKSDGDGR